MTADLPEIPTSGQAPSERDTEAAPATTSDPTEHSESAFAVMLGTYAAMQVVVAATGLVRNKVIALRLGPSAFGEVAQLGAIVASVVAIVSVNECRIASVVGNDSFTSSPPSLK